MAEVLADAHAAAHRRVLELEARAVRAEARIAELEKENAHLLRRYAEASHVSTDPIPEADLERAREFVREFHRQRREQGSRAGLKQEDLDDSPFELVVSPQGVAHHANEYGDTDCGKDATGNGWWWPA